MSGFAISVKSGVTESRTVKGKLLEKRIAFILKYIVKIYSPNSKVAYPAF